MTVEMIEKFVENQNRKGVPVNIHMKERSTVKGLFIRGVDYEDLKSKNFWRVVSNAHISEWEKTNNINLTRIYSGMSFTRLADV
jgi:hypothetical protein